ncbi:hypothetical protein GLOTRDRAFT_128960 [Gloeophyllum trabeum ATCC 11539]|uniref:Thioredoxin domain-containing protein n=1 Tax=Gloeophyllum trabeum (strain ATCC 11539 / FP-39264 / Madison 617) TaxID=670483 RepID=S7Q886_GLOTA|nr:uncharacterized protein GLOTRDRAFT_128960 [Gloeophyllum trabeum ATCC 11539]EPQ55742.1 hypothetical protein GLOTRDRAFT_128960 [Gloeophyllum trabeum ATCC 11539]
MNEDDRRSDSEDTVVEDAYPDEKFGQYHYDNGSTDSIHTDATHFTDDGPGGTDTHFSKAAFQRNEVVTEITAIKEVARSGLAVLGIFGPGCPACIKAHPRYMAFSGSSPGQAVQFYQVFINKSKSVYHELAHSKRHMIPQWRIYHDGHEVYWNYDLGKVEAGLQSMHSLGLDKSQINSYLDTDARETGIDEGHGCELSPVKHRRCWLVRLVFGEDNSDDQPRCSAVLASNNPSQLADARLGDSHFRVIFYGDRRSRKVIHIALEFSPDTNKSLRFRSATFFARFESQGEGQEVLITKVTPQKRIGDEASATVRQGVSTEFQGKVSIAHPGGLRAKWRKTFHVEAALHDHETATGSGQGSKMAQWTFRENSLDGERRGIAERQELSVHFETMQEKLVVKFWGLATLSHKGHAAHIVPVDHHHLRLGSESEPYVRTLVRPKGIL